MSDDEREEKELDLTSPEVVTKYKSAAEIANSYFLSSYIYIYLFFLICIYMLRFFFFWWGFVGLGLFTGFLFDGKMEKGGQEKVLKFKILCSLYHKVKLSGYIGFSSVMFQFDYFLIHSLHFLATKQSFVFLLGTGVMYLVMTRLISENK